MTAGESAAAWAAQARREGRGGPLRRLARVVGLTGAHDARVARQVAVREAGAVGERLTAQLLAPLAREGWYGLYDRAIPGADRANADHVLITPSARVVLVDAKLWNARHPVRLVRGRLTHGNARGPVDREQCVDSVLFEADLIERAIGVPVVRIIAVHNASVAGGGFEVRGVRVFPADRLLPLLRGVAGRRSPDAAELAARVDKALPRYIG